MYMRMYSMVDFGIVKEVKTFWFLGGWFVYPLIRIHKDIHVSIMQYVHILACSTPLLSMLYYHNRILGEWKTQSKIMETSDLGLVLSWGSSWALTSIEFTKLEMIFHAFQKNSINDDFFKKTRT